MVFEYMAIDSTGKMVSGTGEANSRIEMLDSLKEKGMTPIDLKIPAEKVLEEKSPGKINFSFEWGVSEKRLLFFTRQFATVLKAGIPLLRCLQMLKDQTVSKKLGQVLDDIISDIMQGNSLSSAMEKHNPPFMKCI